MRWALLLAVVALIGCGAEPDLPVLNEDCEPTGGLEFICGVISPEDVAAIPNTDFVVASGYLEGGGIHYNSRNDRSRMQVFPTEYPRLRHDEDRYPSCPGPIDPAEGERFSAHFVVRGWHVRFFLPRGQYK